MQLAFNAPSRDIPLTLKVDWQRSVKRHHEAPHRIKLEPHQLLSHLGRACREGGRGHGGTVVMGPVSQGQK